MIYVYAIILRLDEALSWTEGISGSLQTLGTGQVQAIAEENPFAEGLPQDDEGLLAAVIHHDRILQGLFEQVTLLPLRFGSQFQTQAQLLDYLQRHETFYANQLQQFQQQAEVLLSFAPKDTAIPAPLAPVSADLKGRSYFLAKKQRLQSENDRLALQQEQWPRLQKQIQAAYPQGVWSENTEGGATRAHILISFKRYSHLKKQSDRWQQTFDQWSIQVSEPLPPYHFVQFPEPLRKD